MGSKTPRSPRTAKTGPNRCKPTTAEPPPLGPVLRRLVRSRRLWSTLLHLSVVVGFVLVSLHVREEVQAWEHLHIQQESLSLGSPPGWLSPTVLADLEELPLPEGGLSVFEPLLATRLAATLAARPWVKEVTALRILLPRKVEFELRLRRPAYWLEQGEGRVLCDDAHHRLAEQYYPAEGVALLEPLPVVRTEDTQAEPVALQDAHAILQTLEEGGVLGALPQLIVDVSQLQAERPQAVLWVGSGPTRVIWGKSPLADGIQLAPEIKAQRLHQLLSRFKGLKGLELVDLRFDELVVRQTPAADLPAPQ